MVAECIHLILKRFFFLDKKDTSSSKYPRIPDSVLKKNGSEVLGRITAEKKKVIKSNL